MDVPLHEMRLGPTPRKSTNRAIGLTIVAIVHLLFIYALVTGLATTVVNAVKSPLEAALLQETQNNELPPPPPPQVDQLPDAYVPPPDISIDTSTTIAPTAPTRVTEQAPIQAAPIIPPKGSNANQVGANDYPPVSRRLGEEGTVMVRVLVLPNGSVGDVMLLKSSGHSRLDQAALSLVKSKFHYSPATQDGKAVQAWVTQPVQYRLT